MSHKRKASVVASLDPGRSSLNASTSGEDSRLRKRVRFNVLPQTQQMFIDFSNPPAVIIGKDQILPQRRSRRNRLMTEENNEQWRESGCSEEWSGVEDREERRRIQNRISQRKFSEYNPLRESSSLL